MIIFNSLPRLRSNIMQVLALLSLISVQLVYADILVGQWDYFSITNVNKCGNNKNFILEGGPGDTYLDFKDGLYKLYRKNTLVYETPYKIISVVDTKITLIIGPKGLERETQVYIKESSLQAIVSKDIEYVYAKRVDSIKK